MSHSALTNRTEKIFQAGFEEESKEVSRCNISRPSISSLELWSAIGEGEHTQAGYLVFFCSADLCPRIAKLVSLSQRERTYPMRLTSEFESAYRSNYSKRCKTISFLDIFKWQFLVHTCQFYPADFVLRKY